MAAAIVSKTPRRLLITSWLLKRRTRNPLLARKASLRASYAACTGSKCWPPSSSTMRFAAWQTKSTTYGPIGVWRLKLAPIIRCPRSAAQILRSASVEFVRSSRARTRCFVETRQLGGFGTSDMIGLTFVLACPLPTPPPQAGEGADRACRVTIPDIACL